MIEETKVKSYGVPKLWEGYGFPIVFMPVLVMICFILVLAESLLTNSPTVTASR